MTDKVNKLGYFNAISDGTNTATIADGQKGTISFSAVDPSQVSVNVDAKGVTFGLSEEFVKKVNETLPGEITKETNRATGVENEIKGMVGTLPEGQTNVVDFVIARTSGIATEEVVNGISADVETIKKAVGDLAEGSVDSRIATAKSGAESVAAADATSKANAAEAAAKGHADSLNTAMNTRVAALEGINHDAYIAADEANLASAKAYTDEREVEIDKKWAAADSALDQKIEAVKADVDYFFGDALNKENVEAVKDTLKEIQDYINSDVQGAAGMATSIQEAKDAAGAAQAAADKAQGEVDALEGVVAGVKATADAAATKTALEGEISRATLAEQANANLISGVDARVKAVEDDYLKGADKTELTGLINGVSDVANAAAPQATTYTKTEVDNLIAGINSGVATNLENYYKKSETYSKTEVDGMWAWIEL